MALTDQVQLVDDEQRHVADRLPLLRVLPPPRHLVPLLRGRDCDVRLHIRNSAAVDAERRFWLPSICQSDALHMLSLTNALRLLALSCLLTALSMLALGCLLTE